MHGHICEVACKTIRTDRPDSIHSQQHTGPVGEGATDLGHALRRKASLRLQGQQHTQAHTRMAQPRLAEKVLYLKKFFFQPLDPWRASLPPTDAIYARAWARIGLGPRQDALQVGRMALSGQPAATSRPTGSAWKLPFPPAAARMTTHTSAQLGQQRWGLASQAARQALQAQAQAGVAGGSEAGRQLVRRALGYYNDKRQVHAFQTCMAVMRVGPATWRAHVGGRRGRRPRPHLPSQPMHCVPARADFRPCSAVGPTTCAPHLACLAYVPPAFSCLCST